ncbi:MAG: hypothetical protein R2755_18175 [Acidimicrobiales bacterium]
MHIPLSVIAGVDDGVIHLSVERTELAQRSGERTVTVLAGMASAARPGPPRRPAPLR